MNTLTFSLSRTGFEDLMAGRSGVPVPETQLFARIARLNAAGHDVRIIDKETGELINEFLANYHGNVSSVISTPPTK
jgi:hypothetical protein